MAVKRSISALPSVNIETLTFFAVASASVFREAITIYAWASCFSLSLSRANASSKRSSDSCIAPRIFS